MGIEKDEKIVYEIDSLLDFVVKIFEQLKLKYI